MVTQPTNHHRFLRKNHMLWRGQGDSENAFCCVCVLPLDCCCHVAASFLFVFFFFWALCSHFLDYFCDFWRICFASAMWRFLSTTLSWRDSRNFLLFCVFSRPGPGKRPRRAQNGTTNPKLRSLGGGRNLTKFYKKGKKSFFVTPESRGKMLGALCSQFG